MTRATNSGADPSAVGIEVHFAGPHNSWYRATNEHLNGTLRRDVGKDANLSIYSQGDLDVIGHRINTIPRRFVQRGLTYDRYNADVVALTASTRQECSDYQSP